MENRPESTEEKALFRWATRESESAFAKKSIFVGSIFSSSSKDSMIVSGREEFANSSPLNEATILKRMGESGRFFGLLGDGVSVVLAVGGVLAVALGGRFELGVDLVSDGDIFVAGEVALSNPGGA